MKKILLTAIVMVSALSAAETETAPKFLQNELQKQCGTERMAAYYNAMLPVANQMQNTPEYQSTIVEVVPVACELEFDPWRMRLAFQLGHYGSGNGLTGATIAFMTKLIQDRSMGKETYVHLGKQREGLAQSLGEDEADSAVTSALNANLRQIQMDTLLRLYEGLRKKGLSQEEATGKLQASLPELRKRITLQDLRKLEEELLTLQPQQESFPAPSPSGDAKAWDEKKLHAFVEEWLGAPYRWGGVTKMGVDCSGFVVLAASSQFPDLALPRSARQLAKTGSEITRRSDLRPGDFIFFSADKNKSSITHVGVYLGSEEFAHASSKRGVTVSSLRSSYYLERYVSATRIYPIH